MRKGGYVEGRASGGRKELVLVHPCIKPLSNLTKSFTYGEKSLDVNFHTTVSNGCLGSRNDEERSELRYVMRIAEFSESSNL